MAQGRGIAKMFCVFFVAANVNLHPARGWHHENVLTQPRPANRSFSSPNEAASARESNEPVVAMLRAARMKAPQATRASADPTEMRRTPRSLSRATESMGLGEDINTLTGFGATAFTIAAISPGSMTPG